MGETMADYSNYLASPEGYATPQQRAQAQQYALAMLNSHLKKDGALQPVNHWTQGWTHMLNALVGRHMYDQASQTTAQNEFNQAGELTGGQPPGTTGQALPLPGPVGGRPAPPMPPTPIPGISVAPPQIPGQQPPRQPPNGMMPLGGPLPTDAPDQGADTNVGQEPQQEPQQAPQNGGVIPPEEGLQSFLDSSRDQQPPQQTNAIQPQGREAIGRAAYRYFLNQGYQPHHAAALASQPTWESSGRSDAVNPNDNRASLYPHSIGIGQWNGRRSAALLDFARQQGVDVPRGNLNNLNYARDAIKRVPLNVQLDFMHHELQNNERGTLDRVLSATNVNDASRHAIGYERPRGYQTGGGALTERTAIANHMINNYGSSGENEQDAPPGMLTQRAAVGGEPNSPARAPAEGDRTAQADVDPVVSTAPRGRSGLPLNTEDIQARFAPQYPPPPPPHYGMSQDQLFRLRMMDPEQQDYYMKEHQRLWTPQWTEVPHYGRRWIMPATGQSGFVGEPRHGTVTLGDITIPTITYFDGRGGHTTVENTPDNGRATLGYGAREFDMTLPNQLNQNRQQPPAPVNDQVQPPANTQPPPTPDQTRPNPPDQPPAPGPNRTGQFGRMPGETGMDRLANISREQAALKQENTQLTTNRMNPVTEAEQDGTRAVALRSQIEIMKNLINSPNADRLLAGRLAGPYLEMARTFNSLEVAAGRRPSFDVNNVTLAELIQKMATHLGAAGAHTLTNRPTQFDFQAFMAASGDLMTSPGGRRMMVDIMDQMARRNILLGDAARNLGTGQARNWTNMREQIIDQNPITYQGSVLRRENGWRYVRDPDNPSERDIRPTRYTQGMVYRGSRLQVLDENNRPIPNGQQVSTEQASRQGYWHPVNVAPQPAQ